MASAVSRKFLGLKTKLPSLLPDFQGDSQEMDRTISTNSLSSDCSSDSHLHPEPADISVLTLDVRSFKEALARLRKLFHPERGKEIDNMKVSAHECLGEILRILRATLKKYPALNSTEMLLAAGTLIQLIKNFNYQEESKDYSSFLEAVDLLAMTFSNRVSEYLMGDLEVFNNLSPSLQACDSYSTVEASPENFPRERNYGALIHHISDVDQRLMRLTEGVDLALNRAKIWSKYAKDVISYIEKRSHLESEHARNLSKLAQTMRPCLKEESFLPFQSIYCTAIDQDIDNTNISYSTCSAILGSKYIEPLTARRNEHEKNRKQIKETWHRELKKMHDAITNLRKSKALYMQRQQEYEKAKESAEKAENAEDNKAEKKRKLEDDALQRTKDAETTYKGWVVEANERQQSLEKVKAEVLLQIRELIYQCDQTMKSVTVSYFNLQHTIAAPTPVQCQTLCELSKAFEPGSQYIEFVRRLPVPSESTPGMLPFTFEPCSSERSRLDRRSVGSAESCEELMESRSDNKSKGAKMWLTKALPSDSDSVSSTKSQDTSPAASPHVPARSGFSSGDELEFDNILPDMSKSAETHVYKKLRCPSTCKECEIAVYFDGFECSKCGLVVHRNCLQNLSMECANKTQDGRPSSTFGMSLHALIQDTGEQVPLLVSKCIFEIDQRGIYSKGIYRVSGVKSRVDRLCDLFDTKGELVDLSEVHPNVITSVLKNYLRELPEPLLTYQSYGDFIKIARESTTLSRDELLRELQYLVDTLPPANASTLAFLIHHLRRVADQEANNQMPPSNLGIVFGPTLLRTDKGNTSLSSLVDTVHQTRVVELLILYAHDLFDPISDIASSEPKKPKFGLQRTHKRLFREHKDAWLNTVTALDEDVLEVQQSLKKTYEENQIVAENGDQHKFCSFQDTTPSSSPGISEASQSSTCLKSTDEDDIPIPPPRKSVIQRRGSSDDLSPDSLNIKTSASALTAERRRMFFESTPTNLLEQLSSSTQVTTSTREESPKLGLKFESKCETITTTSEGSEEIELLKRHLPLERPKVMARRLLHTSEESSRVTQETKSSSSSSERQPRFV